MDSFARVWLTPDVGRDLGSAALTLNDPAMAHAGFDRIQRVEINKAPKCAAGVIPVVRMAGWL